MAGPGMRALWRSWELFLLRIDPQRSQLLRQPFRSALGLLGAHYINELANFIHRLTGWHPFPPEVYYLERIPSKVYWSELGVNALLTLALGLGFLIGVTWRR